MAARRSEYRLLHRRLAHVYPEIEPRLCLPGERHCNEVATTDGANPTDDPSQTYDWLTFLFPQDSTSTEPSTPTLAVQTTSTSSSIFQTTSTSSSSTTSRITTTSTHHKSSSTAARSQTADGAQSSSSAAPQSSSTGTGATVGGIAAGVIGFALLLSLIAFIMRRLRNKRDRAGDFNTADFRKSAVLIDDPPTHEDTIKAGFNPRPPPSMIENRPPTFGTLYGPAAYNYGDFAADASPVNAPYGPYSPNSPSVNSANPFAAAAPYTPNPFSPLPSPAVESPVTPQSLTRSKSSSTAGPASLSRQGSGRTLTDGEPQYATYPSTASDSAPIPSGDYVDLSRSSVSPFQAAQYAEISQRIGTEVPTGLSTPAVEEHMQNLHTKETSDVPPPPEKSRSSNEESTTVRLSAITDHSVDVDARNMDFPIPPPSPSMASFSRYNRVDSTPPSLPEIRVESRASFATSTLNQLSPFGTYDFPSPAFSSAYPSGTSAGPQIITIPPKSHLASHGAFPVTPSPLNSSFSPSVDGSFDSAPPSPKPAPITAKETKSRPETLYDPEDAYGGI